MSANALIPLALQLAQGLQHVDLRSITGGLDLAQLAGGLDLARLAGGLDLQRLSNSIDLQTGSWIALLVVIGIFVYDLFSQSFGGYAKSLAVTAADVWQNNKDFITHGVTSRDSRSLESLTGVLDALADAAKKWEDTPQDIFQNRAF